MLCRLFCKGASIMLPPGATHVHPILEPFQLTYQPECPILHFAECRAYQHMRQFAGEGLLETHVENIFTILFPSSNLIK